MGRFHRGGSHEKIPRRTKNEGAASKPPLTEDSVRRLPPTEAVPLMAAAAATPKVLPRQLRPVVLARIQFDDFYHFGLLFHYDRFAFRKANPHQGDQHQQ